VNAVLQLVKLTAAPVQVLGTDSPERAQRRAELQDALGDRRISLDPFTRAWKALERPRLMSRDPDREALERAREFLTGFGSLWRDPDVRSS
jgi:hypothetical protein